MRALIGRMLWHFLDAARPPNRPVVVPHGLDVALVRRAVDLSREQVAKDFDATRHRPPRPEAPSPV